MRSYIETALIGCIYAVQMEMLQDTMQELAQTSQYIKSTPWKCEDFAGFSLAIRMNQDKDIECMSWNNRDCLWGMSST